MTEESSLYRGAIERVRNTVVTFGGDLLEFVDIDPEKIEEEVFAVLDHRTATKFKVVPVSFDGVEAVIALSDPSNIVLADDLRMALAPLAVRFVAADPDLIESALRRWSRLRALIEEREAVAELRADAPTEKEMAEATDDGGRMAKLVSTIFEQAVNAGASDIHIEPGEGALIVRFRVDGVLQYHSEYPLGLASGIVSRVKVMASMDISERRLPLDGRFHRTFAGHEMDCRVVSVPTSTGLEGAVIRLLDQSRSRLTLGEVGFHSSVSEEFLRLLDNPFGMILVTGPTGSGKTTTLYASLGQVARPDRKVFTVEDPVEIRFPSVSQVQVNERAGLTFATALKSFLRADPDVILVGEIRDTPTANLASQAALTGHLVLSTLHTNEAAGAPARLTNMGLEGFVIASSLKGVLSQRLLRSICTRCAVPASPSSEDVESFEAAGLLAPDRVWTPSHGCDHCRGGYRGRVVASELLVITEEIAAAIIDRAPSHEIERLARSSGRPSIHQDALLWVADGKTSMDEVRRVGV
jgi:type IV pilus assembly protein PilB